MSLPSQNVPTENVKADYEEYKEFGNQALDEYLNTFTKMWSNLKPEHLEPFAKILMEHENVTLKGQDELIETIRNNLQQQTFQAFKNFWHSNSVSEALISLEMCKKKFKSYEGHKWNMDNKTPLERTRPIRMRFKENRFRYLQAQLEFQSKLLEQVMEENIAQRERIQEVKNARIYLMESIGNFRKKIQVARGEIMEFQDKILSEDYKNSDLNLEDEVICTEQME